MKILVLILLLGIFSIGFATVYAQFPGQLSSSLSLSSQTYGTLIGLYLYALNEPAEMAPLIQYKQGILIENISCKKGLELVMKNSDNMPACLTSSSAKILVERGWATIIDFKHTPADPKVVELMREIGAKPIVLATDHFVMGNYNPDISITLSEYYGHDVLDFKGTGFRAYHMIKFTITNDEGFYVKLKTKTVKFTGELEMPWIMPDSLKSGEYNVLISDIIDSHQLTIQVQR